MFFSTVCRPTLLFARRLFEVYWEDMGTFLRKPFLSTVLRKGCRKKLTARTRVEWCRCHRDWTEEHWEQVLFWDEVRVRLKSEGRVRLWQYRVRDSTPNTRNIFQPTNIRWCFAALYLQPARRSLWSVPRHWGVDYFRIPQDVGPEILMQNLFFKQLTVPCIKHTSFKIFVRRAASVFSSGLPIVLTRVTTSFRKK